MKSLTELFSVFQKFFTEIRKQFHTSIRILRNDNALEYAYTPQQNGVVKRKNRHLVETTRTLLLHYTVPQHFWGDAILTACYLLNRMPSSILGDQIPHSLLFPNQPLFLSPSTCFRMHLFCPHPYSWLR